MDDTKTKTPIEQPRDALHPEGAPTQRAPAWLTQTSEQPPKTLGDVVGFEVITMLAMLTLGIIALRFEPITDPTYWLFANPLLIMYASGVAFNLLDAMVRVRHRAALPGAPRWRGSNYTGWRKYLLDPAVFNFMFDTAFLAGVIIVNPDDESSIILFMIMLTAARFFSHVPGRRTPHPSPLTPGPVLPAILPLFFFSLQKFYTPNGLPADNYLAHVTLAIIFVLMPYAFISLINQSIAEEAALTVAIAERDKKIKQSEITAAQDAKRLAEQVLRLDLLQDSIRAINSAIELDELLLMIVNNAVRVLEAEQSSIGLIDERTGELIIQCATGVEASKLRRKRFMPGVGVAGWVAQKGLPLIVGDVTTDTRYIGDHSDANNWGRTTRSMLCVPLIAERKVIGILCVTDSQPNALTEEDQALLTGFAEQAALAVHKSKLLDERTRQGEELRRRGDLIASLHTIGQSVLSTLDLPQVLDTIISRMSELTSFDQGVIYLLNDPNDELEQVATTGHIEQPEKMRFEPGTPASTLWKKTRATGRGAINRAPLQSCKGGTCVLCLPLVNRGKLMGCILLAREGDHQFNDVERDTAEKLADAATVAIVNARLFGTVSAQQQRTAALYRLMLKVNAAGNRRQLAQLICNELQQILGATASALLIHDTEHARITGWACHGDWLGYDIGSISLPAQGDPFVSSVLSTLHQFESPGLVMIPNAPPQMSKAFKSVTCMTIPLAQSGRIYGLLVVEPGHTPPIPEDIQETASLAVSHSTVALERAELFEQTLTAARQSGMLYSIAAEIQTSLDPATVVEMTVNGALEALPILSCELYIFDDERKELRRVGMATAPRMKDDISLRGPKTIAVDSNPTLVDVLNSPGMVEGDIATLERSNVASFQRSNASVVLGRLMGSEEPLGILRLTTTLPAAEFMHRHATFCQTLLTHSGGALERSRLYTTTASQALALRQRTDQLTDILNLGILSVADVPLPTLMPQIAANIARSSLRFAYVRLGQFDPEGGGTEVWASTEQAWPGSPSSNDNSQRALSLDSLRYLMDVGKPTKSNIKGVYLDEALLAEHVPGQPRPRKGATPRQLVLMPLESINGGTLGYILAALNPDMGAMDVTRHDFLEVLSIFALRISLIMENHIVYSQLLDSKRKIEGVVLSISDGVIVTDADLKVLITNSLADQLLGVAANDTQGQPLESFISDKQLIDLLRECVTDSKSGGTDVDLGLGRDLRTYAAVAQPITGNSDFGMRNAEYEMQNGKSNGENPGALRATEIRNPHSMVLGAVLTLRDVTAERATERAKSDFLSIVSHELRTPLNSVMGFLDIILMGKTGELTDLQADFLGTAKQEAVALQRLINDLLDYSQLQSRMLRLEMAPVNLSSIMSRVANQALPRMEADDLTLVNNVPQGLLVVGDEIRLEQVFKNLLDNAAKFTDPGGEIRFECSECSDATDDTITISVSDNGTGIPPAQVADVFDRFFQAENVASRPKRGLGLGLAICKNIVEAHGGRIWLESELGVGTTVHVELLLFNPDSNLYSFDTKTGKATLTTPLEPVSAER